MKKEHGIILNMGKRFKEAAARGKLNHTRVRTAPCLRLRSPRPHPRHRPTNTVENHHPRAAARARRAMHVRTPTATYTRATPNERPLCAAVTGRPEPRRYPAQHEDNRRARFQGGAAEAAGRDRQRRRRRRRRRRVRQVRELLRELLFGGSAVFGVPLLFGVPRLIGVALFGVRGLVPSCTRPVGTCTCGR